MKNISIYIKQLLMLTIFFTLALAGCKEDDEMGGTPVITNVRVVAKDSSITAGELGLTIAIQGQNLGGVRKVLFNDLEAPLNPVYVTNSNIIVTIPDKAPSELSNTITLVTGSGLSTTKEFTVVLPEPQITGVYNEFVLPGKETSVLGNYFYFVQKVMLGDKELEILETTPTAIRVKLHEGEITDYLTVVTESGTATSTFRLRETEGNMVNFDIPATDWGSEVCWGSSEKVDPSENTELEAISGKYVRIKQTDLAQSSWQDDWVFSTCTFDFKLAPGSHTEKMFKFEHNVVESWKAGFYEFAIKTEDGKTFTYNFKPWDSNQYRTSGYKTTGWKTAYIPLSDFKAGNTQIADVSKIRDITVAFKTPDAAISSFYVAIDNIRIVNK